MAHPGQVLVSHAGAELLATTLGSDVHLREIGEFELKGMARPEKVFQVVHPELPSEFPNPKAVGVIPNNLPTQLSSFVGRQQELAEVLASLRRSRLVTLTGSGGSGKTRIALEAASECSHLYLDGVWMVELAAIAEPGAVPSAIAAALDLRESPGTPLIRTICSEIKSRTLLLILDNCEHLLDACSEVAQSILKAASKVHVLATSREALGVAGEIALRIPSMTVPHSYPVDAEELMRFDATRLFVERAQASDPSFAPSGTVCDGVVQICRRLDGIPLAIELAASRLRGMPVAVLAERIEDRFRILTGGSRTAVSRQRTLRALIDWSYDLLTSEGQRLLRTLSVFAGGWTLEAAEAVGASGGTESWEVLDLLSQLVEKSLVLCDTDNEGNSRYRLLETIRQYASDKLADEGESEDARARHMRYWEESVRRQPFERDSHGDQLAAFRAREADWENLRSAIEWALCSAPEAALHITAALGYYFEVGARLGPGFDLLARALDATEVMGNTRERAIVALSAARLAFRQMEFPAARTFAEKARSIAEVVGDEGTVGAAIGLTTNVEMMLGRYDGAREGYEQMRAIGQKLGDAELDSRGAYGLMLLARQLRQLEEFKERLEECDRIARGLGLAAMALWVESYRGSYAEESGDMREAAHWYGQALRKFSEYGEGNGAVWQWECIARVCSRTGRHETAATLFGASDGRRRKLGWPIQPNERPRIDAAGALSREALGDDYFTAFARGCGLSFEESSELALQAAAEIEHATA